MANNQNLKPIKDSKVARELQEKSVKARKENKEKNIAFRKEIEQQLGDSLPNIVKALIARAKKGDVKASEFLRDTIGQKPVEKQEVKTIESDWFK